MLCRTPLLVVSFLALCLTHAVAPQARSMDDPISGVDARKRVSELVHVRMEVRAAKDRLEKRGEIYLDSEDDFRDEKNFAVVITEKGAISLRAKNIPNPAEHFLSRVILARGVVKEVDDVPRIEVEVADQIKLVDTE